MQFRHLLAGLVLGMLAATTGCGAFCDGYCARAHPTAAPCCAPVAAGSCYPAQPAPVPQAAYPCTCR